MNYLSVENISKAYGERVLFDNVSFGINKDQKIAFIAKNGSGKTTIMNIINGFDEPDTGQVVIRKGIKMAFLSQNFNLQDELTIEESIFASDNEVLQVIRNYEKALENYNKSLELRIKIEDNNGVSTSYHNIGEVYKFMEDYELAKKFYFKAF